MSLNLKMNKSDLINNLNKKNQFYSKADLEQSLNLILDLISSSLSTKNRVEVRGFGSFSIRLRDQRVGRNPKTGTSIKVEKKYHPYFRAAKSLKETLK